MCSDIESMRAQLLDLGVVVPRTDYAYSKPATTEQRHPRDAQPDQHARKGERSSDDAALHGEPCLTLFFEKLTSDSSST